MSKSRFPILFLSVGEFDSLLRKKPYLLEVLFGQSQRAHFCPLYDVCRTFMFVMTRGWELETGSKLARWVVGGGGCVERWPTPPSHLTFYRRVIDSNWKVFISTFCRSTSCKIYGIYFFFWSIGISQHQSETVVLIVCWVGEGVRSLGVVWGRTLILGGHWSFLLTSVLSSF